MIPAPFQQLAVALGLGLLVGLQRERADPAIAGIRTFALITVLGAVAALLAKAFGGWVVALGLVVAAALVLSGNLVRISKGEADPGQATEFAALVMYGVGALVVVAPIAVGVVLGGAVAVLLHLRDPLHRFVGRIGEKDIWAIMQFVLIAWSSCRCCPTGRLAPTTSSIRTRSGGWWCSSSVCRSPAMWPTSCSAPTPAAPSPASSAA